MLGGGRSSRMGRDKLALERDGETLLAQTCSAAARFAERVIVAGPMRPHLDVEFVPEDPPFGGPVAGIAAAVAALVEGVSLVEPSASEERGAALVSKPGDVLILAGDLANAEAVVDLLAHAEMGPDGVVLQDDEGWPQYLAGRYRLSAIERAARDASSVRDISVRRFLRGLDVNLVPAPASVTADVDTPEQAAAWGY
ncbi:MAG: NTP transferase domain-containing protein [Propionibacteriaceae bacterium]|nr:NTP transferase domain-containing protein [Propionibacteriaceae bacterium]